MMPDVQKELIANTQVAIQSGPVLLNLGGGDTEIPGYRNIDIRHGGQAFSLNFPDDSVDVIRASHVLEHFSYKQVPDILLHWVKKLKPGGRLAIAVPDFRYVCQAYATQQNIPLQGYVMGKQTDENDFHKCLFDRESLHKALADAGLERISDWISEIGDCVTLDVSGMDRISPRNTESMDVSLHLQGWKPTSTKIKAGEVCGILSAPRFSPTMHFQCALKAFGNLHIPYYPVQGAYWHQVLSETLEIAVQRYDMVVTCDYDSIFTPQDVGELLRIMKAYPKIDALFAIQYRRHDKASVLGSRKRELKPIEMRLDAIPMDTGHFGLTVFRSSVIKELERPWFISIPDHDGRWKEGKVDADVMFWRKFTKQGFKAFMAPKVRIGHMQELIAFPDENFQPVYISLGEYLKDGVPAQMPADLAGYTDENN